MIKKDISIRVVVGISLVNVSMCKYVPTKENNFLFEVPISVDKKLLNNGIFYPNNFPMPPKSPAPPD